MQESICDKNGSQGGAHVAVTKGDGLIQGTGMSGCGSAIAYGSSRIPCGCDQGIGE